jgi:quinol monooxygenase YgiN
MLIIAGGVAIRPEKRDEAIQAAIQVAIGTQGEEGCIAYRFYTPVDDPNALFVFEQWTTEEALQAHLKAAHTQEFLQQLPEFVAGPPGIRRYEVASESGLL